MVLAPGIDKRVGVCDIETMHELFDVGVWDMDKEEWIEFEVSKYKNDLYKFVHWYTSKPLDYLVTFNGVGFDQQILQYIVDKHQGWYDLTNLEICKKISDYAQKVIENSKYGLFPDYKEDKFSIPALDVFKIHHFDNEAKMTSLKWCAFMMNMDVEEMPIRFDKKNLLKEEIEWIQEYRRNDVRVTQGVLYITLGQVSEVEKINGGFPLEELMDYKGKNAIQSRFGMQKETGMPCLNWSDVKIGEEWNRLDYKSKEGIKDDTILFPKKVKQPYGQKFKNFFPPTMQFITDKMKKFIEDLGNQYVKAEKQEFPITIGDTKYTVAKGGLHSTEKNRCVVIPVGYLCTDADVGAQYPNSIVKLEVYAPHLKRTIILNFIGTVEMKDRYKQMVKDFTAAGNDDEASRYKGLETGTKLRMNGGYFGKLGQKGSFLEYPEGLLKVCMGNQIEILMLIEMLDVAGFQVISGNTDGIVTLYPQEREKEYKEICHKWEEKVGNVKMGKLEYANFSGLWQDSINSYIAKTTTGKVKKKGRFMTEFEMHKNKSARIIPLALEQYFINGKNPADFVREHKNIFDFCLAKKATGMMFYEEQWEEDGAVVTEKHKKLVRYFISKEGTVLWKRGFNYEGKRMNNQVNAPTELGQPLITYFNKGYQSDNHGINYNHYILEILERIDAIEKTKKAKAFVDSLRPNQQGSLF